MAAPIELVVLTENFITGERNSAANEIVSGIQDKKYEILQVVESLGSSLSNKDVHVRVRGSELLAEILNSLPKNLLVQKEVEVFSQFFRDRLKDHHSVTPHVISGIQSLVQSPFMLDDQIELCVRAIFREIHVQSLTQADRRRLYHLVDYLLSHRLQCLQKMGTDFIFGYVQAMDGEKDPRNLVIAFRCVRNMARHIALGTLAEDLFEVVACYFPIEFTPPSNDPHGITKEMLVVGLRDALASNSKFAEFCMPLLLEKLSSSMKSAKVDSFLTLVACAEVYGEKINEYTGSLWSCIRREVLAASSEPLEQAALSAMSAIIRTLSRQVTEKGKTPILEDFVREVFHDVKRHICEPEQRLVQPTGKLLRAITQASIPARDIVLQQVLPLLLEQFNRHKQVSDRRVIIGELNAFIFQLTEEMKHKPGKDNHDIGAMVNFKADLYELFTSLLSHSNARLCHLGVQGILGLIGLPGMVSSEEVDQCSQYFLKIAFEGEEKQCREDAITGLGNMTSHMTPGGISLLSDRLTEMLQTDPVEGHYDVDKNGMVLQVMAGSCACTQMVKILVPFLLSKLRAANKKQVDCISFPVYISLNTCLHDIVSRNIKIKTRRDYLFSEILPKMIEICLDGTVTNGCVINDWRILQGLSGSVRQIVCELNKSEFEKTATSISDLFMDGSGHVINFKPFDLDSPSTQTQLIVLFTAIVCSGPKDVMIPRREAIVEKLLEIAIRCQHQETAISAAQCLAGLLNKFRDDDYLKSLMPRMYNQVTEVFDNKESPLICRQNSLNVVKWTSKALLLRSHQEQQHWIELLMQKLSDPALGQSAADGFHIILSHCYEVLREDQHANVMFMYRQRMFILTVETLIQGFHQSKEPEKRIPCLVAISHLLKDVPQEAVGSHLPKLLPLLLQCLDVPDGDGESLWISALHTLGAIVMETPRLISQYTDELVAHLLKLTGYKPKMSVRRCALILLGQLTTLEDHILIPHQHTVTQNLTRALDDHKRLVRREAVATREKWILIGAPGT